MTEVNIVIHDERNTVVVVDERPNIEVSSPGPQGRAGRDADITVSDTPPDNPALDAIWVQTTGGE